MKPHCSTTKLLIILPLSTYLGCSCAEPHDPSLSIPPEQVQPQPQTVPAPAPAWWENEPTLGCPEPLDPANNRYAPQAIPKKSAMPARYADQPMHTIWQLQQTPCAHLFYYRGRIPAEEQAFYGDRMNERGHIHSSAVVFDEKWQREVLVLQMTDNIPLDERFFEEFGTPIQGPIALLDANTGETLECINANPNHRSIWAELPIQVTTNPLRIYYTYKDVQLTGSENNRDVIKSNLGFLTIGRSGVVTDKHIDGVNADHFVLGQSGEILTQIFKENPISVEDADFALTSYNTEKGKFNWIKNDPPFAEHGISGRCTFYQRDASLWLRNYSSQYHRFIFHAVDSCAAQTSQILTPNSGQKIKEAPLSIKNTLLFPDTGSVKQPFSLIDTTECGEDAVQVGPQQFACVQILNRRFDVTRGNFRVHLYDFSKMDTTIHQTKDFAVTFDVLTSFDLPRQIALQDESLVLWFDGFTRTDFGNAHIETKGHHIALHVPFFLDRTDKIGELTHAGTIVTPNVGVNSELRSDALYMTNKGVMLYNTNANVFAIQTPFGGLAPTKYPRGRLGGNDNRGYARVEE